MIVLVKILLASAVIVIVGRICWRSWRQLREEEERAIREMEESLDRFIAFTRGCAPVESGDRFCWEKWGEHTCYLDKDHEGPHVCGLCEEGLHEAAS